MTQAAPADTGAQTAEAQAPGDVDVQEAELPEATDPAPKAPGGQIDILLGTTMEVVATLGEAEMRVADLLKFGPGTVIQLDRQVGEPVDLLLNGIRFATGHLVVVGDQLGIRVKDVLIAPPVQEGAEGEA